MAMLMQPAGNAAAMNLREMYGQCSLEDPDITPLDFVFEHLLNLESIVNYFEGESESNEAEHLPNELIESFPQFAITIPKHLCIDLTPVVNYGEKTKYPLCKAEFYALVFYADIFHPPIT